MVAVGGRSRVAGALLRCVCVCLCAGAVSCRVSRVVARYFSFVVRHQSLIVDCPSLCCALLFCVVLGCVVWCVVVCVGRWRGVYASNTPPVCTFKRPSEKHVGVVLVHTGTF